MAEQAAQELDAFSTSKRRTKVEIAAQEKHSHTHKVVQKEARGNAGLMFYWQSRKRAARSRVTPL